MGIKRSNNGYYYYFFLINNKLFVNNNRHGETTKTLAFFIDHGHFHVALKGTPWYADFHGQPKVTGDNVTLGQWTLAFGQVCTNVNVGKPSCLQINADFFGFYFWCYRSCILNYKKVLILKK